MKRALACALVLAAGGCGGHGPAVPARYARLHECYLYLHGATDYVDVHAPNAGAVCFRFVHDALRRGEYWAITTLAPYGSSDAGPPGVCDFTEIGAERGASLLSVYGGTSEGPDHVATAACARFLATGRWQEVEPDQ